MEAYEFQTLVEREAFELAVRNEGYDTQHLKYFNDTDSYAHPQVQDMWWAWQARAKAYAQQQTEPVAVRVCYPSNPHKWVHAGLNDTIASEYDKQELLFTQPPATVLEYAEIYVGSGLFALVDWDDFDKVKGYKWNLSTDSGCARYAQAWDLSVSPRKRVIMHRLIMPCDGFIDHINHNGLDNRKANLRVVTCQQNSFNMTSNRGSSKYKGVSFEKSSGLWKSYISINGKKTSIGRFGNEIDAARAYDLRAKEFYGEYAKCNF